MASSDAWQNDHNLTDELQPGAELMRGQYTIRRYLNSGGFGITYLAKDSLDRPIVIKECFPRSFCRRMPDMSVQSRSEAHTGELRSIVRLFTQEARSLAKLKHPFIVGVHQTFEENNTAYMALDFVKGHDLLAVIEQKVMLLRPDQVRAILEKVLDAIGCVHNEGLLHRDISPDNIIITTELNPVLIDFGAAREQATKASRALSTLRVVKDGYSPQEFYIAGSDQGPFSDLYSLAATFYHVISGELPPDSQRRISAHVKGDADPYVPLARKTDDYDESFCAAIDKAMAILPGDRVQSADEWLALMSKPVPMMRRMSKTQSQGRRKSRLTRPETGGAKANARSGSRTVLAASVAAVALVGVGVVAAPSVLPMLGIGRDQPVQLAAVQEPTMPGAATNTETASTNDSAAVPAPTLEQIAVVEPAMDAVIVEAAATPEAPVAQTSPEPSLLEDFAGAYAGGRVTSNWVVELPFTVNAGNTIAEVANGAPQWLEPGLRIVEVNGVDVSVGDAMGAVLEAAGGGDGRMANLSLVFQDGTSDARLFGQIDAVIVYETQLSNGYAFATRHDADTWRTTVTQTPGSAATGLQEGDVIVGLVGSDERLADGVTVARLMAEAIEANDATIEFAVRRDGLMWVETIEASQ